MDRDMIPSSVGSVTEEELAEAMMSVGVGGRPCFRGPFKSPEDDDPDGDDDGKDADTSPAFLHLTTLLSTVHRCPMWW